MSINLAALNASLDRDLFLPTLFGFSLGLEQVTWAEICEDPGLAMTILRSAQGLVLADGLVNWLDPWLEAEAAGAPVSRDTRGQPLQPYTRLDGPVDVIAALKSKPIQHVREVTRRLVEDTRDHSVVLGCITGAHTLARNLYGRALGQLDDTVRNSIHQLMNGHADLLRTEGIGGLMIAEHVPIRAATVGDYPASLLRPDPTADVPVYLMSRHPVGRNGHAALGEAFGAVIAPGSEPAPGLSVMPLSLVGRELRAAMLWRESRVRGKNGRTLFFTEWDVPRTTPLHRLAELRASLVG